MDTKTVADYYENLNEWRQVYTLVCDCWRRNDTGKRMYEAVLCLAPRISVGEDEQHYWRLGLAVVLPHLRKERSLWEARSFVKWLRESGMYPRKPKPVVCSELDFREPLSYEDYYGEA